MATYRLHNWSIVDLDNDPYRAPECVKKSLRGTRDNDDHPTITSYIVEAKGRRITTYSGSVYLLEEMDPGYQAWLHANGWTYDPENPIVIRKV